MAEILACPDTASLQDIALGRLPSANAAEVIAHVAKCADCTTRLESMAAVDPLVEAVTANSKTPDSAEQEAVRRLLERVRGLFSETKAGQADRTQDLPTPPSNGDTLNSSSVDLPDQGVQEDDGLAPPRGPGELGWLSKYRILKVLGEGGMGKVYLAEDPALKRQVALKVMKKSQARNLNSKRRFLQEAQTVAQIEHDNIVHIYQVDEDRGIPFLAMPLLKGLSLEDLLRRSAPLQLKQTLRVGIQIAEGLAAAHANNLIHRDIKPANIWIEPTGGGRIKILDFGLARSTEDEVGLTQSGAILGTPSYMPPEQARGEKVDHRADLYSLGCVLYRMTTGELPIKGHDTMSMLLALALHEPTSPNLIKPLVPKTLSDLIMQLLEKDPAKRLASAKEVVQALKAIERGLTEPTQLGSTDIVSATMQKPAEAPSKTVPATPPPPEKTRTRGEKKPLRRVYLKFVLAGIGLIACLLLVLSGFGIIRIATPEGNYVFKTDDPTFKLSLSKDTVILEDTLKKRTYKLNARKLPTGEYELEVTDPDNDLVVHAKTFSVKRGETVALKAWFERTGSERIAGKSPVKMDEFGPYDSLKRDDIDPYELKMAGGGDPKQAPEDLVAIFGDSRFAHFGELGAVVLNKDGKTVITAGRNDGLVLVWDRITGRVRDVIRAPRAAVCLALNSEETVLAVGAGGEVVLYEYGSWKQLQMLSGHKEAVADVALSPDGKIVAGVDWANNLVVWNAATGNVLKTFSGEGRDKGRVAFSPDGKVLAASGLAKDFSIRLWEVAAWKELPALKGHKAVPSLAFASDSKTLYSAGDGLRAWDLAKGEGRVVASTNVGLATVALGADGKTIATADTSAYGNNVLLYNAATGQILESFPNPGPREDFGRTRVAWSREGKVLAASQANFSAVGLWDLNEKTQRKEQGYRELLHGLAVSPDGKTFVTGSLSGTMRVWDVKDRKVIRTFDVGDSRGGISLAMSPDGKRLATLSQGGSVRLWDPTTGKLASALDPAVNAIWLNFSPDGRYLAAAGHQLWWWDLKTMKLRTVEGACWNGMAFTPDGNLLAKDGNRSNEIPLLNASTGEVAQTLVRKVEGGAETPVVTADGGVLASRTHLWDRPTEFIDLKTGKQFLTLPSATFIASGPREQQLAGTIGSTLWVWDSALGRKEYKFGPGGIGLPGVRLGQPAFSPDGRHVLISNGNGTVYVVRLQKAAKTRS